MLSVGVFGDGETFFTAKGAIETVADTFNLKFTYERGEKPFLHPGMTANVLLGDTVVGYLGRLSYEVCEELAIEKPVFVGELDYELLSKHFDSAIRFTPISKFASETRDLALVCSEETTCGALEEAIASSCKYITSVTLFDVYRGAQIGEGKKSMAFKLVFSPDDHEFTGEEIDGYVKRILKKLQHTMGVELR